MPILMTVLISESERSIRMSCNVEQQQLVAEGVPSVAAAAVLVHSTPVPEGTPVVRGEWCAKSSASWDLEGHTACPHSCTWRS